MKKQILILDDDVSIRTLLDLFLRKDYNVVAKKDGVDAMMWLEEGNIPDLIISDVNMPHLNGYDFLINLKKSGYFRTIPVMILSGIENVNEKLKFFEIGAFEFVYKPFNPTDLLSKIDAAIQPKNIVNNARAEQPII